VGNISEVWLDCGAYQVQQGKFKYAEMLAFLDKLKEVQFLSEDSIKSAVKNLRDKLQDFLIEQEQLSQAFHSLENPPTKSEVHFKRWLRNKVIRYGLPQPQTTGVESQHGLWDYYEIHALTGSETACPAASKPRLLKDYFENHWYNDFQNV
jgi:hypothetical protein